MQVVLRMLCSERVHDSTALMTGVLAAGRHGAWAVSELMLVSAFKSRFKLPRLAALPPPAVSAVPEQFQEVRTPTPTPSVRQHRQTLHSLPTSALPLSLCDSFHCDFAGLDTESRASC